MSGEPNRLCTSNYGSDADFGEVTVDRVNRGTDIGGDAGTPEPAR